MKKVNDDMDSETFCRLSAFLELTAEDVAEGSGYSLGTVKGVRRGVRRMPDAVSGFIRKKLRIKAEEDKAIQVILNECRKANAIPV